MTVSLTASKLLVSAFKEGDFTGWPDFVRMDDGVWMTQMFLSVSKRRMCYSVLAKAQDPKKTRCIFVLCIDQASKGMEGYHNKVGIMDVLLSDDDMDPKLVMSIDYGEHIVLDAVKQPAIRSLEEARATVEDAGDTLASDGGESDQADTDDGVDGEDDPRPGILDSISSSFQRRKEHSRLVDNAKAGMPPRSKVGMKRNRRVQ